MDYGKLNSIIKFVKLTQVKTASGGSIPGEEVIKTSPANVVPLKQSRTLEGNQQVLKGGYQITIRYRRDFEPKKTMFIRYGKRVLTIASIQQAEENREFYSIIAMAAE